MEPTLLFFVAAEFFTGAAFGEIVDARNPLVASPYSWLAFVARVASGDSEGDAELVEIIANAMVRDTVFGLASGYTFEEILAISNVLTEGGGMTFRDVRELRGPEMFDMPEIAEIGLSPELMSSRFLQRKARRSVFRAERDRDVANANADRAAAESEVRRRDAEAREAIASERERALAQELKTSNEAVQAAQAKAELQKNRRFLGRRRFIGALLAFGLATAITSAFALGLIGALFALTAAVVLVWAVAACWTLFLDVTVSVKRVIPFVTAEAAILALGVLLPRLFTG